MIQPNRVIAVILGMTAIALAIALALLFTGAADAHDAIPTAAQPQGWTYPYSCCSGYDCRRVGDNAPLPSNEAAGVFVTEGTKGFMISSSKEVIPHTDPRIKESPDGEYHWCSVAGAVDGRTLCLYVPPRSF